MKVNVVLLKGGARAGLIGAACTLGVTGIIAAMGKEVSFGAALWNGVTVAVIYMLVKWEASRRKKIAVAFLLIFVNCAISLLLGMLQVAKDRSML